MKKLGLKVKMLDEQNKEFFIRYEDWIAEQKLQKQLFNENLNDYCNANSSLKDKLRTTPDSHILRISKVFRIDWSKIFKKGKILYDKNI